MLFNSYEFILFFLPLSFVLFWYVSRSLRWRLTFLTLASYFFYSWWQFDSWQDFLGSMQIHTWGDALNSLWHWRFTLIMLFSSSVDYWAAKWIVRTPAENKGRRKLLLALSLTVNLALLGFFKYFGFFTQIVSDINHFLSGGAFPVFAMVLPVGISFYTFESMSYVIDIYRGVAKPARSYLDYACFVSLFPHLVAGPIIRYSDLLHQFRDVNWVRRDPDWDQVNIGLLLFVIGMIKKTLLADKLANRIDDLWACLGSGHTLGFSGSWAAVLGYTFRIYFDFSAYSDMAVGIGHLFAIRLPQNFNSPYKATDPIDFWRRWHMSLSAWLRDYLYIPLGGNRYGKQTRNLMFTMLLGGLWHGAAWLFVVWGAWHGLLLAVFHWLKKRNWVISNERPVGYWFNRQITFLLVVIGWVLFRAADVHSESFGYASVIPAFHMFKQMLGLEGFASFVPIQSSLWLLIAWSWIWCNFVPNSFELVYNMRPLKRYALFGGAAMAIAFLEIGSPVDFLYFRF